MDEQRFIAELKELGLDPDQLQSAKNKVPTFHQMSVIVGKGSLEWSDEQIEAYILEERKRILDEYRQSGEEWERALRDLDKN